MTPQFEVDAAFLTSTSSPSRAAGSAPTTTPSPASNACHHPAGGRPSEGCRRERAQQAVPDHPDAVALLQHGFRKHVHVLEGRSLQVDLHERARHRQRVRGLILGKLQEYRGQPGLRSDHRGDAHHLSSPGCHSPDHAGRAADYRIQVFQIPRLDRRVHLQCSEAIDGAQTRRSAADQVRRPHQLADLDIRVDHPAGVRQGDVGARELQLSQLEFGLRLQEPRFGLR